MYKMFFILLCFIFNSLHGNPFLLSFPCKESLTEEDLEEVQQQLRSLNLKPSFEKLYPEHPQKKILFPWKSALASKEDFFNRISKATKQILIDRSSGKIPIKKLIQIGKGGDNCLVSFASFNGKYDGFLKDLPLLLEKVGFNGYLFYRIGGFPNPTGKEIRYAAVPYSFKIFSLLEAQKLGFSKVLWIDSAFIPLRDPTPLFEWIEQEEVFLKQHESFAKFILPKTRECLKTETGVDVLNVDYVSAQIIGFDLSKPACKSFVEEYYRLVELGYPFFSCFPEEYVFTAIIGKNEHQWKAQPFTKLIFSETKLKKKDLASIQKQGYFFFQKEH